MSKATNDRTPLLEDGVESNVESTGGHDDIPCNVALPELPQREARKRSLVSVVSTLLFITAIVASFTIWNESLSSDPHKAALTILEKAPVIVSLDFLNFFRVLVTSEFGTDHIGWAHRYVLKTRPCIFLIH